MPPRKPRVITPEGSFEAASRTIYTIDGLWFLGVEEKYGFEAAFKMNQQVWKRGALIHGKRLLKQMKADGMAPLEVLEAMILVDPIMTFRRPEATERTARKLVIRTLNCPPAEARYRDGRGVFNGIPGCTMLLSAYAELIDPRIKARCICCTPNPDNPEYWCEWKFTLSKTA